MSRARRRTKAELTRKLKQVMEWRGRMAEFPQLVSESPSLSNLARKLRDCEHTYVNALAVLGVEVTIDLPPWPIGQHSEEQAR